VVAAHPHHGHDGDAKEVAPLDPGASLLPQGHDEQEGARRDHEAPDGEAQGGGVVEGELDGHEGEPPHHDHRQQQEVHPASSH
jgi:hypothetical protein